MPTPSPVQTERAALCDALDAVGPDAPTLCEGWRSRDLASHLLLREHRPDATLGIRVRPLARWTKHVQDEIARRPYREVVDAVRKGSPIWSPLRIATADAAANLLEFVVHCEDVRRAQPGWRPRALDPAAKAAVARQLPRTARFLFRRAAVGVALQPPGRPPRQVRAAKDGRGTVIVAGEPVELLMFSFGRSAAAQVELRGDDADVQSLAETPHGA